MGNLSNTGAGGASGRSPVRHLTVSSEQAGQRLDNFLLRELKGLPRSRLYRLVRKGEVRVNLGRVDVGYRLQAGDAIRIPPMRLGVSHGETPPVHIEPGEVLFEDSHLLVLDKPSGLPVHKGTGVRAGVIEALRSRRPDLPFLELVHRLDRDTSGCLVLAKSRTALTALHVALRREGEARIGKYYAALVKGELGPGPVRVRAGLRKNSVQGGERMVIVTDDGDSADSVFRLKKPGGVCSLVEIELVTGRTHQARVHAWHIGHPIAGDRKYGDRDFNKLARNAGLKRLALHAHRLELTHPVTGGTCVFEAPLPKVFEATFHTLAS